MAASPVDSMYPPSPLEVPANLTAPSPRFVVQAWFALLALLLFVLLYVALVSWAGWVTWSGFRAGFAGGEGTLLSYARGAFGLFVLVFLARGLFAVRSGKLTDPIELAEAEEPKLFSFLHRLADEAGAPRPHRVFLTPDVNASVFYDISFLNFFIPSRKNLNIGLGLVNTLDVAEFKAVLAHEFGHFAQRSMAIGRWVYVAEQIAGHIIMVRGWLDRMLTEISYLDLRIAWLGWILRLVVWAFRAVLDTAFRGVVLATRALSREMELQADLVSVSLTGSDALIHALHKLHAADESFSNALGFLASERRQGRCVPDLYAVHTRFMEILQRILTEAPPAPVPDSPAEAATHRVFPDQFARPPKMWSTHPPNREREDNAKRHYLKSPVDNRSAWALFSDRDGQRTRMTDHLLELIAFDLEENKAPVQSTAEDALTRVDDEFSASYLSPEYCGLYVGNDVARHAKSVEDLFDPSSQGMTTAHLYPPRLHADLETLRNTERELFMLEDLRDGFLEAPGRMVRHRGRDIHRRHLEELVSEVRRDTERERLAFAKHLAIIRGAHQNAAHQLDGSWPAYHRSLVGLVHYAEHTLADVRDAHAYLANVWNVVSADGKVSNAEVKRLVSTGSEVHRVLDRVFQDAARIRLPETVLKRLEIENWSKSLGDFDLPLPTEADIGVWLDVTENWLQGASGLLQGLRNTSLEVLVDCEAQIRSAAQGQSTPEPAPEPAQTPDHYHLLPPGEERKKQRKLGLWDRFQLAEGWLPGLARLAVSGAILSAALAFTGFEAEAELAIYNGLATSMTVVVGDEQRVVGGGGSVVVDVPHDSTLRIETTTLDGQEVEAFNADTSAPGLKYVYNIAGATPLVEWTLEYGGGEDPPPKILGAQRFQSSWADFLFEEAPRQIRSSSRSSTRTLVEALGQESPGTQLNIAGDAAAENAEEVMQRMIMAHLRFDPIESDAFAVWADTGRTVRHLELSSLARPGLANSVPFQRLRHTHATAQERARLCRDHLEASKGRPEDPGLQYLRDRCLTDSREHFAAVQKTYDKFPNDPWVAGAAFVALTTSGRLDDAARAYETATVMPALKDYLVSAVARLNRVTDFGVHRARFAAAIAEHSAVQLDAALAGESNLAVQETELWPAVSKLYSGRLEEAVTAAEGLRPEIADLVLRLAAASDGATPGLRSRAAALPPDTSNQYLRILDQARAVRDGLSRQSLPDDMDVMRAEMFARWTDPEQLHHHRDELEAELQYISSPAAQGLAYASGVIILGNEAPAAWRQRAQALLFPLERPYFAP